MIKSQWGKWILLGAAVGSMAGLSACNACSGRGNTVSSVKESSVSEIYTVEELTADAEELVGRNVILEGTCAHLCRHGARKMFVRGTDSKQLIRVQAVGTEGFSPESLNRKVRVSGVLDEQRVDEAYLDRWEARLQDGLRGNHGEGEGGCSTEKQSRGETASTEERRIADFRKRIEERRNAEGKAYLSFYYLKAESADIL